ncbi:MAG: DUF2520 domain-containing protein [Flavobacteriales bacterium]|nr:hypothetical protein [Flavobacteriales bacterium]MCC6576831.1 DUF2520 domain-containing protein [Flavobacteriales bacterium]NUQ14041.1 DUF2520 domain-containing protein [Flavobacteriales bacterium]
MALHTGILLVGTGRAAHHLGHAIVNSGRKLVGVAGRTAAATDALARSLGTAAFALDDALPEASLTLLAVSDDAIAAVASRLGARNGTVAHLSGATDLDRLLPHAHRGALWPVMSLSPGDPLDLRTVPLVVDANGAPAREALLALAQGLSGHVVELTTDQRRLVHLAAVLTANFPVALFAEARALLHRHAIGPDLLTPLWTSTAAKAATAGPEAALTGPARRGDRGTLERHQAMLANDPRLQHLYRSLSELIATRHTAQADAH